MAVSLRLDADHMDHVAGLPQCEPPILPTVPARPAVLSSRCSHKGRNSCQPGRFAISEILTFVRQMVNIQVHMLLCLSNILLSLPKFRKLRQLVVLTWDQTPSGPVRGRDRPGVAPGLSRTWRRSGGLRLLIEMRAKVAELERRLRQNCENSLKPSSCDPAPECRRVRRSCRPRRT